MSYYVCNKKVRDRITLFNIRAKAKSKAATTCNSPNVRSQELLNLNEIRYPHHGSPFSEYKKRIENKPTLPTQTPQYLEWWEKIKTRQVSSPRQNGPTVEERLEAARLRIEKQQAEVRKRRKEILARWGKPAAAGRGFDFAGHPDGLMRATS